ncbi:MAG: hypothetical protein ABSD20_18905 [Terriglobales bacterium]|jgi:hypothetical protein
MNRLREERSRMPLVVIAVLVVIFVAVGIYQYVSRPKPQAGGALDSAFAVALPGDRVLASISLSFRNIGKGPFWIREIKARLTGPDGKEFDDAAASPVDFERYFQAFPDLKQHSIEPLKVETKVEENQQVQGSIIVAFPVTLESFRNRKSLAVLIYPYTSNPFAAATAPPGSEEVVVLKESENK